MRLRTTTFLTGLALAAASAATADEYGWAPSYTFYGTPGLIEMPSGLSEADGQFTTTFGGFADQQRFTLSFQVTERISGSFRYSYIAEFGGPGTPDTFDRSFDLRYRVLDEGRYVPAVTVGLQDFLGTGRYSGEYVAATKHITPNLRFTAGIGWGRLGSQNSFANPLGVIDDYFDTRPVNNKFFFEEGGTITEDLFFRGDAAAFGGVEYRINDEWTVAAEYSSDAYARESGFGTYDHDSPYNFGVTWQPRPEYVLQAAWMNGSTLGFGATFTINPNDRPTFGGRDPAPLPVGVRTGDARAAATWDREALPESTLQQLIVQTLETEGLTVHALEIQDRQVRVRYENTQYRSEAQAAGRISRILSNALPPSMELFVLEPERSGIATSRITIRRSDLEALENEVGATEASFERAEITDAAGANAGMTRIRRQESPFQWGVSPYFTPRYFDQERPLSGSAGLQFAADYYIQPNLVLSGLARYRILGNRDEPEGSNSALPPVRTNAGRYFYEGNPSLDRLTLAHYGRPATNLYSRVTVGYLERMFGGVSGELLWKPVNSAFALGAEVNYARQREFDVGFGFQDYDIWTGHASAYYDMGNGFHVQVDAGRYLAGDWGATVAVDREFENGWKVGAYVTRTDVSAEDYGEGSFDKGLRITIPTDWTIGTATRQSYSTEISSLRRDGGARLEVEGRLYEVIRDTHGPALEDTWGRFWR